MLLHRYSAEPLFGVLGGGRVPGHLDQKEKMRCELGRIAGQSWHSNY